MGDAGDDGNAGAIGARVGAVTETGGLIGYHVTLYCREIGDETVQPVLKETR